LNHDEKGVELARNDFLTIMIKIWHQVSPKISDDSMLRVDGAEECLERAVEGPQPPIQQ
jgi:hypothetical protein